MAEPFIGEVKMVGFDFAPVGWAFCDGALLPISQNDALFSLIGTIYGGDGQETFALPDLRGRFPVHQGERFIPGETGGSEAVTLTVPNLPPHIHQLVVANNVGERGIEPQGKLLGSGDDLQTYLYSPEPRSAQLSPSAISSTGGSQPHNNMQPYLALNFVIAIFGIFPSRD